MLKAIFVIAGHGKGPSGAPDMGAQGNGTNERTEVLQVARETVARLKMDPDITAEIILIDQDLSVTEKVTLVQNTWMKAEGWKADETCLVDIHLNATGNPAARGAETWYGKNDSPDFAKIVLEEVVQATGFPKRSVLSSDSNRLGRLGILDDTTPQACLVELGFVTNELDAAVLKDAKLDDVFAIGLHRAIRRQCGLPADVSLPTSGYMDVPDGAWFSADVKRLTELGVFVPADDRLFHPDAPVNRAQAAVMLGRLFDSLSVKKP